MADPAHIIEEFYTYADLLGWSEDERWELVDGMPENMSPAPGRLHQQIVGDIFSQLHEACRQSPCQAFVAPFDVRLQGYQDAQQTTTVVQPDILVVCDEARLDERGCLGAPDLVVEVVSPRSAVRDNILKLALYERFRIPEYWIAHPVDRLLFQRVLEQGPAGPRYGIPAIYGPGDQVTCQVLTGVVLDLGLVFAPDAPPQSSPTGNQNEGQATSETG